MRRSLLNALPIALLLAGTLACRTSPELEPDEFGAQPTAELAWKCFLEVNRRGIKEVDLGIYDEASRALLRRRPNTDASQDEIARLFTGAAYEIRQLADRAAIVFPEDTDHRLAPWFFHRTGAGWVLDGAALPPVIGYNHRNQWRFKTVDHPYAFAFEEWHIDRQGVATYRPQ